MVFQLGQLCARHQMYVDGKRIRSSFAGQFLSLNLNELSDTRNLKVMRPALLNGFLGCNFVVSGESAF
jgi:hypothetical protein